MQTLTGDLWDGPPEAWRVVTVNLTRRHDGSAVMGRGVAKQAADLYPDLPRRLGHAIADEAAGPFFASDVRIAALPVKRHWRDRADPDLIARGLRRLRAWLLAHPDEELRTPLVGAGFGELTAGEAWALILNDLGPLPGVTVVLRDETATVRHEASLAGSARHDRSLARTVVVNARKEPYDVYIGRAQGERGRFGNPFVVGQDGTREEVIERYAAWLHKQPDLLALLPTLRGKRLGCWCKPAACHGDVLAQLADALPADRTGLRVLVTGSRTWDDPETIRAYLGALPQGSLIVHGAGRGADTHADRIAQTLGLTVERHPADWEGRGRGAGPARNAEMVAAGADLALAFRSPGASPGTDDTIRRCEAARIPVVTIFNT